MNKYLVSFSYHDVSDWILSDITKEPIQNRSTAVFIRAPDEASALKWGQEIASRFMEITNEGKLDSWASCGHTCWVEKDVVSAGWEGAESFLQDIRIGEEPDYERLTTEAYMDWLEEHGDIGA